MTQTLADTKPSIDRFLFEAQKCAEEECGFAAMLTAFTVILGIAETEKGRGNNDVLLGWFVTQLDDKLSWLITPNSESHTDDAIGKKLADIRNSLSHQISLPDDVELVNTLAQVRNLPNRDLEKYFIGTTEFVEQVKQTANKIVKLKGTSMFDSERRYDRGPADRIESPSGTISSASTSQFSISHEPKDIDD